MKYSRLECNCKVSKNWPFLVSVCPHGNKLVNKVKRTTKKQELAKMPDAPF